ncbi:MAG: virulence protein RhuM/Fic/DOC family protein [Candidatus Uhrbacteria bacterium]|nr:virulence protein RhuM/Fic/DOC family protein [Candidatus Uhrbacteria bacterium]
MKQTRDVKNPLAVYQAKSGAIELRADADQETIWATQAQIVTLFSVTQSVVSRHIGNIFAEKEADQKSNMQKMHNANSDKPVIYYSLDIILAVGYRTNSSKAVDFRKWATKTLRQHITQGYTINPAMIAGHYDEFLKAVEDIKALITSGGTVDVVSVLDLVRAFADTWMSLDAYDKDALPHKGSTRKTVALTADGLREALVEFKETLVEKGQASDLFGLERVRDGIDGIVGNVMQSFGGKQVYPTVEEKAAHLLYFIVKNHPLADGNKRSAAFAFVWFLRRAKRLDPSRMSPEALTVLTLLIAESNPRDKEKLVGLVCRLLARR